MKFRVREAIGNSNYWVVANGDSVMTTHLYINADGYSSEYDTTFATETKAQIALNLYLSKQKSQTVVPKESKLIPVSHKDYMSLSDAYDTHSRELMSLKGEEYSINGDFLAMENRLAGMLGDTPENVSLVMAGKHITAIGIILEKNEVGDIKLEKLDERIRDACNLLKITAAFVHAKQSDFSLHLDKEEKKLDCTKPDLRIKA